MRLAEFTTEAGLVGFQKWQRSLVAAERAACRLAPVLASCLLALLAIEVASVIDGRGSRTLAVGL